MVQLGEHVIQQQHRPLAGLLKKDFPLSQLQGEGRRAGLTLGAVGLGRVPVDLHCQVVLMGAGQTLTAVQLRLPMGLLVLQQLGQMVLAPARGSVTVETVSYRRESSSFPPEKSRWMAGALS